MFALLLFAACDTDAEGAYAACDATRTDLALDETSALGFSAAEVLLWLEAAHTATLVLDGESVGSELTVTVTSAGTANFVDQEEAADDGSGAETPAIAAVCDDYLELDVGIDFATADGAFAEHWDVVLPVEQVAAAQVSIPLEVGAFVGSYTEPAAQVAECDTSRVQVDLYFSEGGGISGDVWLVCEKTTEDTVSEGLVPLGSWGDGEEE